jgi:hypothetical protein
MDFIVKEDEKLRTAFATIATATAIEAGDLVAASSGLVIKAVAGSTKLAWSPKAHAASSGTQIEITMGNDFVLQGDGDAAYAVSIKGTAVDMVVTSTVQYVDVGETTTKVFIVCLDQPDAVVGAVTDISVRIALPLY